MTLYFVVPESVTATTQLSKLFDPDGDGEPQIVTTSPQQAAIHTMVANRLYGVNHKVIRVEINDLSEAKILNLTELAEKDPEIARKAQEILEAHQGNNG